MELSRITSKGQITIPVAIRKKLNLKEGDKVIFIEEKGRYIFANAAKLAFREIQDEMVGEAEAAGLVSEDRVNQYVKEIRKDIWEKKYESDD
jgi:antitoxin PrlF